MMHADDFFSMQRERYQMMLRRKEGRAPWTTDPVLSKWRFCNVFREDDRTTRWFRENIREPLRNSPDVLMATVAFRWFNRIETGEKLKPMLLEGRWDSVEAKRLLWNQEPIVTGAYMIKTPAGMDKLEGVCWCIDQVHKDISTLLVKVAGGAGTGIYQCTLQEAWKYLREYPYFGPFMAYEVVSDLRHTHMLENASDIMHWANAGPGCARGLGRVAESDPDTFLDSSATDQRIMNSMMQRLLVMSRDPAMWPAEWPRWEMREVEHGLCEYDKYVRGKLGNKLKRRYP